MINFYDNEYENGEIRYHPNNINQIISADYDLPSTQVVTVDDVKNYLKSRLNTTDDEMIAQQIDTATNNSEKETGRAYITRQIEMFVKNAQNTIMLPYSPIGDVTSIEYYDEDGTLTALTTDDYTVFGNNRKYIKLYSRYPYGVVIIYSAGYGQYATSVPAWVKEAVMSRVAHLYAPNWAEKNMLRLQYREAESPNVIFA